MAKNFRIPVTSWGRGIVDNIAPDQIPDDAVADALNMEFDRRQQLRSRNGCSVLNGNQNLIASSYDDFTTGATIAGAGTITADADTGPFGDATADVLDANTSVQKDYGTILDLSGTFPDAFTVSFYVKMDFGAVADNEAISVTVQQTNGSNRITPYDFRVDSTSDVGLVAVLNADTYTRIVEISREGDVAWLWISFTVDLLGASGSTNVKLTYQTAPVSFGPSVTYTDSISLWGQSVRWGSSNVYTVPSSTTDFVIGGLLDSRVTSVYQHRSTTADSIYATCGSKLYEFSASGEFFEDVTGSLNLPDDTLWQWTTFDGKCIGVNRATTASGDDNPIVFATPGATPAALTGSPPKGRYITTFNKRVWIVDEDEPWKIHCSKLGDAEDWTDTGPASGTGTFEIGGAQENFPITGIHVHQNMLLCFKRDSIYAIVPGSPNTDLRQYEVVQLTTEIGCLSGYAIKTILNDVIFLSRDGVTTLGQISRTGNYDAAIVSRNIAAFEDFERVVESAVAAVYPRKSQYILSFRAPSQGRNNQTYILDYSEYENGVMGWTRADGALLAQSFGNAIVDDEDRLLIGGGIEDTGGVAFVWLYDDDDAGFSDAGINYEQVLTTKAFAPGDAFARKRMSRWGLYVQLLQDELSLNIRWQSDLKRISARDTLVALSGQVAIGAQWDAAVWDSSVWGDSEQFDVLFANRRFTPTDRFATNARLFQAEMSPQAGQGWVLRGVLLEGQFTSDKEYGQ